jgi:hypothetical protein
MNPLGPIALSAFMAAGQAADAISTDRALATCTLCREGNPLMQNQAVRWTAKGALVAGGTVAVVKLWPNHRKSAIALGAVVGGIGFAMARHNQGFVR